MLGNKTTEGPIITSKTHTTEIVETIVSETTTKNSEGTTISSKPSLSTTTTPGPFSISQRATTKSSEGTTISSKPSLSTTTTPGPFSISQRATTKSSITTIGIITGQLHTTSVLTNPSVKNTTTSTTEHPLGGTTYIAPITQTLPGSTTVFPSGSTFQTTGATVPSSPRLTTTLCVCNVNGTSHHPGDLLYNVTDGLGWCYSAYCNASCKVETRSSPCPTSSTPSTTAHSSTSLFSTTQAPISSSVPLSTTTTTASTTTQDCYDLSTPKKNGESWKIDNCTTATCKEGKITFTPKVCPNVTQPICANARKPVQVYEQDGCCFHYECECVCSVWSGSYYMTFDGQIYNLQQNCSFYLVKEIISKYNLTITRSNDCDPSDSTFCPLALTVTYKSVKVVLTQVKTSGTAANVVYVNQKRIYPAYSNSVLLLFGTDMEITALIPEINTTIIYRGSSFKIDLPYSLFGGNTEGQCGTCDNSQANDCRSPNGQIESCAESAELWTIPGTVCVPSPTPSAATTEPVTSSQRPYPTTQPACKPAICELIMSSLFAPCHSVIAPGPFVTSCAYEICSGGNNMCSSLEAYAAECSSAGVCIDWRNATNGLCEHRCPSNKVYMACGPSVELTCNDRYNRKFQADVTSAANFTQEGCFCPQGTTLFNSVYDTCVTSCDCVGSDGKPKEPGETWTSGCNTCECDQDSMSVHCNPVKCPEVQSPNCTEPGQQLLNKTEGCCTTQTCECNFRLCGAPPTCLLGFQLLITNGTCCQSYECVPKGVCVYDLTEFKPGAKIPTPQTLSEVPLEEPSGATASSETQADTSGTGQEESFSPAPCHQCYCSHQTDPTTKLNAIKCTPVVCNTSCSEGFEYQPSTEECCGTCVQKSCVFTTPQNQTVHVIKVNGTFVPPDDKCVEYTCEKINGQVVVKETRTTCPPFNPLDCEPGTETADATGCCKTCRLQSVCEVDSKQTIIEVNSCVSAEPLNVTSCVGHCRSSSMYSAAANTMMHQCECCYEATTSIRQVELTCADGSKVRHSYTHVETCRCSKEECPASTAKPQRRRRR
uniref:Intestinal mucin-like protein n=1 Tax=Fundulus heteroclitus TaxID=8078 RepID=A0A3Q2TMI4_FUNHE